MRKRERVSTKRKAEMRERAQIEGGSEGRESGERERILTKLQSIIGYYWLLADSIREQEK